MTIYKVDNLDKMNTFLKKCKITKLTQKAENLNKLKKLKWYRRKTETQIDLQVNFNQTLMKVFDQLFDEMNSVRRNTFRAQM